MPTPYAERIRRSREHARIASQAELARRLSALLGRTINPQTIQYLEDPKNKADGSQFTASIAHVCGVNAVWLESEIGAAPGAQQYVARAMPATYTVDDARAMARDIMELRPPLRVALRTLIAEMRQTTPQGPRRVALSGNQQRQASQRKPARQRSA